jgi:hypothetical protein
MMFSAIEIANALNLKSCRDAIESIFDGAEHDASYDACVSFLITQRADFLDALEIVDEADRALLIATSYIEQKSRWLQWNLVLNYKMMMYGTFDRPLACKASALSNLLGRIEPFIDVASLTRINEMLDEPVLTSAP